MVRVTLRDMPAIQWIRMVDCCLRAFSMNSKASGKCCDSFCVPVSVTANPLVYKFLLCLEKVGTISSDVEYILHPKRL